MGLLGFLLGKESLFGRTTVSRESEDKIKADWQKISVLLKTGGPSNYKQALLTADRSLDTALKDIFAGETMGERLKEARTKYERPLYNQIWEAHKMRNSIVHEANFEPPYYAVQKAVDDLKRGIQALGVNL